MTPNASTLRETHGSKLHVDSQEGLVAVLLLKMAMRVAKLRCPGDLQEAWWLATRLLMHAERTSA